MSISDELMWNYYELLSFRPLEEIAAFKQAMADGQNPRDLKILLAKEIIARFHSDADAEAAEADFINRFQKARSPMKCHLANLLKALLLPICLKKRIWLARPPMQCA